MVDIALCEGEKCPKKNTCYRFKAIPDKYWQSYFKPPYKKECEYFMSVESVATSKQVCRKHTNK